MVNVAGIVAETHVTCESKKALPKGTELTMCYLKLNEGWGMVQRTLSGA
jgi:hypothetical protein